ncbi:MAG: hypothetical protein ACLP59_17035 [Bryobacteraceae bacterium]
MRKIAELLLGQLEKQLYGRGLQLAVTDEALTWLCERGRDEYGGARPLRRLIEQTIQDRIASELLHGRLLAGACVFVEVVDGSLVTKAKGA